jgi:uncharacterized protein
MTSRAAVDEFIHQRTLAVVGVSRSEKKFASMAYSELKKKGYRLFPVNPNTDSIAGERCYASLRDLPEPVDGVVVIVPPAQAESVVRDAYAAGICRVWLQQQSETPAAIHFCQENGISVVHGECILMFAEPTASFHKFHRTINWLFGKAPK